AAVHALRFERVHPSAWSDQLGEQPRLEAHVGPDVDHDVARMYDAPGERDLGGVLPALEAEVEGPVDAPGVPEERAGERIDEDRRHPGAGFAAAAGRPVTSISPRGRGKLASDQAPGSSRTNARASGARAGAIVSGGGGGGAS